MAVSYKTLLLLLCLFHVGRPQTQPTLGQNFCASNPAQPDDNLSCTNVAIEGVDCFPRSELCNDVNDCQDGGIGSDEGDSNLLNPLECKFITRLYYAN